MKILITGATGLVGQEITKLALLHGHTIHYLTTSKNKIKNTENEKGFFWNPTTSEIDHNCLEGVEKIIHLAGATVAKKWTDAYKQEIIESRTISSNLLLKLLKNHQNSVNQIVSASAIGIYPSSETEVFDENSTKVDDGFLGQVVKKWEESVDNFRMIPISICKIRIGLVLSEKGGALVEIIKPTKLGLGAAFGSGNQMQSWIHVEDLAHLFLTAVENDWTGVYNGVAPHPVTNQVLSKEIAKTLDKPFFLPNIPEFVMKIALGEMHQILFSSQHVSASKAQLKGFKFKYPTLESALKNLLK
ncbi:MAG: TIGR01777 family oxidoreductase [Flavobacterium sp.]